LPQLPLVNEAVATGETLSLDSWERWELPRKDRNVFTIMIVPHSETKVFTFRLSTLWFQVICYTFVCLFLFMMILARSYQTMAADMWELEQLRLVNREQREQIDLLVQETTVLQQRMIELEELEQQVREMMELESYRGDSGAVASLPSGAGEDLAALATTASVGGTGGGAGGTLPQTGGATLVSRMAIQEALGALDILESVDERMSAKGRSLTELRARIAENMSYEASRPSIWPVHGYITSGYGYRLTVFGYEYHQGLDIAARTGTPIVATADGTVVFAGWNNGYGNTVVVEHGHGFTTVYGHCSKMAVSLGDRVKRGEVIAFIGDTGRSTGPHIHYEVRINGRRVNPVYYLRGEH